MFRSLYLRLTVLCIALAVIPLAFVGALLAWQSYELEQKHVLEFEQQITERAALQVSGFITNIVDQLSLAIVTSGASSANPGAQEQLLSQVMLKTNVFDELAWLDQSWPRNCTNRA